MANITVLGCGRVGSAIAKDLAAQHAVLAVDISEPALQSLAGIGNITVQPLDVSDPQALHRALQPSDIVINAVPGFLGFTVLKNIIRAGKNVVDISFYAEDALGLDSLAKQHKVCAVVDMGVAPGMSNLVLGYHDSQMTVQEFKCYVGGLPKVRTWPFYYKAPFSPVDVLEEYTRPARLVEYGRIVEKSAMSGRELVEFDGVGTLEAFNTDGLRTLLTTMGHVPHMVEKTLRYPGHAELIQALQHSGFFQQTELLINDVKIAPRALTAHLLTRQWQLHPREKEFTVMRIEISGLQEGEHRRITYNLYDEYHEGTQVTSMARTTGYACAAAANLLLCGLYQQPGVSPPEYIGRSAACFDFIMEYVAQRSIRYTQSQTSGTAD